MICTQKRHLGNSPRSIAPNKSSCVDSRVWPTILAASSFVQCLWPSMVLKWNLTQKRSFFLLMKEYVCEPKPSICRTSVGKPRSENKVVTWCKDSGDSDQKSHIAVGERRWVLGWRFCV